MNKINGYIKIFFKIGYKEWLRFSKKELLVA